MEVRTSYDAAANAYAEHLADELTQKPLDRHLLNRFAEELRHRGPVVDMGCGPGHIARYLHEQGVNVLGIDLSAEMIRVAQHRYPGIEFRVGDMSQLELPDGALAGIVAFYSIVHLDLPQLAGVLREFRRVLTAGGHLLLAFHVGDTVVHVDDLFGCVVSLDFRYFQPNEVVEALQSAHFSTIERVERAPYEGAEYPSQRCYLLVRAT